MQIIAFCFHLHFAQHPKICGVWVVCERSATLTLDISSHVLVHETIFHKNKSLNTVYQRLCIYKINTYIGILHVPDLQVLNSSCSNTPASAHTLDEHGTNSMFCRNRDVMCVYLFYVTYTTLNEEVTNQSGLAVETNSCDALPEHL